MCNPVPNFICLKQIFPSRTLKENNIWIYYLLWQADNEVSGATSYIAACSLQTYTFHLTELGLLGKDWEGYYFKDDLLYVPEWRRGFTPHEIRALFWKCQQIRNLNNEINLLKQELERRNEEYNLLEIRADFYKRQVILESRFGLMLQRSFS